MLKSGRAITTHTNAMFTLHTQVITEITYVNANTTRDLETRHGVALEA